MQSTMYGDVLQNPKPGPQAHLALSTQRTDWQDTAGRQISTDAASGLHGLPRAPESARLPPHKIVISSDFIPQTKHAQAHHLPERPSEQSLSQADTLHNGQVESGIRHGGQKHARHTARDPEKGYSEHSPRRPSGYSSHHTTIYYEKEDTRDESAAEEHSVWILIYLSCLSIPLALLYTIYTLLTTLTLLLLLPLTILCTERKPLSSQLRFFLLPPIIFQLGLIYSPLSLSPSPSPAYASKSPSSNQALMLITINLLGPVYAAWVAAAAWIAAGFWAFAAIMGDPDGRDGRDDGRAAVLGVRGWWERWLGRAVG